MNRLATILAAMSVVLAASCKSGGPQPHTALPAGADFLVSMSPPSEAGPGLTAVMDRIPEGNGIVDLLSSLTGIDLRDDEATRDSGIDPQRGVAAALWSDGVLVILPMADEDLGGRRIRLRLARMGFVEVEGSANGVSAFESARGAVSTAGLRVGGGLAFVCLGRYERCEPGNGPAGWDPAATAAELAMPKPLVVGIVRGGPVGDVLDAVGLRGTAKAMAQALIGDVRFAIDVDRGFGIKALAGPIGDALKPGGNPSAPPSGVAALVALSLPPAFTGNATGDALAGAVGGPLAADIRLVASSWSGDAVAAVMADESAAPAPLVLDWGILKRLDIAATLGFANEDSAVRAANLIPRLSGLSGWLEARHLGKIVRVGSRGTGDRGLVLEREGLRVLHVSADPGLLLQAMGGGGVEFVRHMVDAVSNVYLDLWFGAGRPRLEAGMRVR